MPGFMSQGVFLYSPPLSLLLGLQYLCIGILSWVYLPLGCLDSLSLLPDDEERGAVLARVLLISGLASIALSLFAARQPLSMAPSALFLATGADLLRSRLWEQYPDGELYAMGAALRIGEVTARAAEVQGAVILASFITSLVFGVLWYFGLRPPSVVVQSTLIVLSATNIQHLLHSLTDLDFGKSLLFQMPIFLLMLFFLAQNLTVPLLKVITNQDRKIRIKIFKLFPVLLTFVAGVFVNVYFELDYDLLLARAVESYTWISFSYIPKGFNLPVLTLRGLAFLPTLLSQSIASYCCYSFVIGGSGRETAALLVEAGWNVLSPLIGVFLPLSVDSSSLGLYTLTQVKNTETTVISGSLLVVMASFLKVVALTSYSPPLLLAPIYIYLHAHLIATVLAEMERDSAEDKRVLVISVMAALTLSTFTPSLDSNLLHSLITIFVKNPVILTFLFSLLMLLPNKNSLTTSKGVIHSIV